MNGTNLFKIALRALANNKLRAFLTMLGIIIGVASVIAMLAIGQGSKKSIQQQISEMGSNMIMIHPGAEMRGGVRQDPSAMQTLKLENYEKLSEECTYLSGISPNVSSSGQLVAGANNYPSSVSGVSMDYLTIRQLTVEQGEMFTENDSFLWLVLVILGQGSQCGSGRKDLRIDGVFHYMPVTQADITAAILGYFGIVSDKNKRTAFGVQLLEKYQNLERGTGIQITGRLISQNNGRIIHQGTGNGHTLHLSAGHLIGFMFQTVTQSHSYQ
jgi:ABC-type antimicrobial peptide transport system permease subunit